MAAARWTTTRLNLGSGCFCFFLKVKVKDLKKYQNAHKVRVKFFCAHFVTERMAESVGECVEVLYA